MAERKAVTIILTHRSDPKKIYLVERNPKLKFFGGYFAYPGGTLDLPDKEVRIEHSEAVPAESLPYIAAAVRETFEETGVLLARASAAISAERLALYRKDLLSEELGFNEILQQEGLVIDARDFHFVVSLLTPEFAPIRYDTQFYKVQMPAGQEPTILEGELISGDFYTAERAFNLWQKGEMSIVPPVIFMLRELLGQTWEHCIHSVRVQAEAYKQGAIHEIYFTPGVHMLPLKTRTLAPATHTNCYLVGDEQLYIIDPAPTEPAEQQRLWDYLEKRVAEGRQLKGILLTHHHADHVGAVSACQEKYGLPVFAHKNTIAHLTDIDFERPLNHGDELELGKTPDGEPEWKLNIYHTPGHAAGHLTFRESRYGAVIAGDLLSTLSTIIIAPPEGHMATYMRSLQFLETITDGTIYPSHGSAVKTGKLLVQHFIKHRQEREDKILTSLTRKPQAIKKLVQTVYNDVNVDLWPLAEQSLQAGLIKLIEEEKCRKDRRGFALNN